jgi:hypothetical protein
LFHRFLVLNFNAQVKPNAELVGLLQFFMITLDRAKKDRIHLSTIWTHYFYNRKLDGNDIHTVNFGDYGVFRLSHDLTLTFNEDRIGMNIFLRY